MLKLKLRLVSREQLLPFPLQLLFQFRYSVSWQSAISERSVVFVAGTGYELIMLDSASGVSRVGKVSF